MIDGIHPGTILDWLSGDHIQKEGGRPKPWKAHRKEKQGPEYVPASGKRKPMLGCYYVLSLKKKNREGDVRKYLKCQDKYSSNKACHACLSFLLEKHWTHLSQTTGLDSFMTEPREEHGCRGGGAMGTAESRELVFRWRTSWARAAPTATAWAGPSPSTGQEPTLPWAPPSGSSGPTAPCRGNSLLLPPPPPPLLPSSTSRVGEAGGDTRGFRLVEAPESNFNKPFLSF